MRRGLADPAAARRFLHPSLDDLLDPSADARHAGRPSSASGGPSKSREKILIYGDYDVDGTMSVVLLTKAIATGRRRGRLPRAAPPERRLRHAPGGSGDRRRPGRHA